MMKQIVQTRDLKMVYKVGKVDVNALRGVDIAINEGEFVSIMGPSGCGKSTLLHLMGGLLTPSSGEILIDGENLAKLSDAARTDLRRRKIGFIFQRFNLFPTLTAEGNLKLAEHIAGNGNSAGKQNREEKRPVIRGQFRHCGCDIGFCLHRASAAVGHCTTKTARAMKIATPSRNRRRLQELFRRRNIAKKMFTKHSTVIA